MLEGDRLKTALLHLSKDPILKPVIDAIDLPPRHYDEDVYLGLVKSIISQQLSVKAANTITGRFLNLFENQYPDPEYLLLLETNKLRSVGLSGQKTQYVKNVAAFFTDKNLFEYNWSKKTNEEIIALLTQIKGVGKWTVEMILMFVLKRTDVLPVNDLGIQQGIQQLYAIQADKKELIEKMETVAKPWKPYRSLACLYLWAIKDMP
ncbi:MAG: DNA-3-methyladenine glycosylase 2 family protein [Saprospiraceae bacterium]|nr:DNA-3-methyladenine glycosylase 2 family protein [Saprospiraceae bacterium]